MPVEAFLAHQWGQMASVKYHLEFYFPSPNDRDDDCPAWPQRLKGVHCKDCGKLMLPAAATRFNGLCYHCHLEQESSHKLKTNAQESLYGIFASEKDGKITGIVSSTNGTALNIISGLGIDTGHWKMAAATVVETAITEPDILRWKEVLYQQIVESLPVSKPSQHELEKQRFNQLLFEGESYYYGRFENLKYARTSFLIGEYEPIIEALAQQAAFKIYYFPHLTYREDVFMRFIHYVSKGEATMAAFFDRYKKSLTAEEISTTLKKMEEGGLLHREGEQLSLTAIGKLIM